MRKRSLNRLIEHIYCNDEWRSSHPEARVWNSLIFLLDHGPIMIEMRPNVKGRKRPYRLESWALVMDHVITIVREEWGEKLQGSRLYVMQRKLQNVRAWCLEYKKTCGIQWDEFKYKLGESQNDISTIEESIKAITVKKGAEEEASVQRIYWKQRSRSRWDAMGDQITSFFLQISQRKANNFIGALQKEDGSWIAEQGYLKHDILNYFKNIYAGPLEENEDLGRLARAG